MQLKSLFLSILIVTSLVGCKTSYDLKFNPKAGTRYDVQLTTNSTTMQETMGDTLHMKSQTLMAMQYEIAKADADNKELKVVFKSMRTSQNTNGHEMVVDTKVPDKTNSMWHLLNSMMGNEFLIGINARGEVTSVKGMQAMIDRMTSSTREQDSATGARIAAGMKNFMSDDILKNMMEQSFKIFPAGKVKEGDSWQKTMEMSRPMPMHIASTYSLKEVKGNIATLTVHSVISPGKESMEMMGMKIETNLNGVQDGTMDIDVETGMALSTEIKQNMSGKLTAMGREVPMAVNSIITLKSDKL